LVGDRLLIIAMENYVRDLLIITKKANFGCHIPQIDPIGGQMVHLGWNHAISKNKCG